MNIFCKDQPGIFRMNIIGFSIRANVNYFMIAGVFLKVASVDLFSVKDSPPRRRCALPAGKLIGEGKGQQRKVRIVKFHGIFYGRSIGSFDLT